jgi:hypothetical protein
MSSHCRSDFLFFFVAEPVPWTVFSPKIFFLVRAVSVMSGLRGLRQPFDAAAGKKFRISFRNLMRRPATNEVLAQPGAMHRRDWEDVKL